jgi:hypothetical protein
MEKTNLVAGPNLARRPAAHGPHGLARPRGLGLFPSVHRPRRGARWIEAAASPRRRCRWRGCQPTAPQAGGQLEDSILGRWGSGNSPEGVGGDIESLRWFSSGRVAQLSTQEGWGQGQDQ